MKLSDSGFGSLFSRCADGAGSGGELCSFYHSSSGRLSSYSSHSFEIPRSLAVDGVGETSSSSSKDRIKLFVSSRGFD